MGGTHFFILRNYPSAIAIIVIKSTLQCARSLRSKLIVRSNSDVHFRYSCTCLVEIYHARSIKRPINPAYYTMYKTETIVRPAYHNYYYIHSQYIVLGHCSMRRRRGRFVCVEQAALSFA